MTFALDSSALSFKLHEAPDRNTLNLRFDESLMQHAAATGPAALIWQAPQGLVVPRTYLQSAAFDDVCQAFRAQGWPVSVRHSGGGVVPQGPGILNISLAYAVEGRPLDHSDTAYQLLCNLISDAIAPLGIQAHTRTVEGSFCDGRFNLAVGPDTDARKIAGTAQLWRRVPLPGQGHVQTVLVHALLLVACDVEVITRKANALELALGNTRRYLPERAASLHRLVPHTPKNVTTWVQEVRQALEDNLSGLRLPNNPLTP